MSIYLSSNLQHRPMSEKRMLGLHKQLAEARMPQAQTLLKRQIDAPDRQIDRLVSIGISLKQRHFL